MYCIHFEWEHDTSISKWVHRIIVVFIFFLYVTYLVILVTKLSYSCLCNKLPYICIQAHMKITDCFYNLWVFQEMKYNEPKITKCGFLHITLNTLQMSFLGHFKPVLHGKMVQMIRKQCVWYHIISGVIVHTVISFCRLWSWTPSSRRSLWEANQGFGLSWGHVANSKPWKRRKSTNPNLYMWPIHSNLYMWPIFMPSTKSFYVVTC